MLNKQQLSLDINFKKWVNEKKHNIYLFIHLLKGLNLLGGETDPLTPKERDESLETHLCLESDSPDGFLVYRGFIVRYNYTKKCPNYTIHLLDWHQVSQDFGSKAERRSTFFVDDTNLIGVSATNGDYKKSGYDRGHMVPAGDFYWNQLAKRETFVLSNISPQKPLLNRGMWARLEQIIRNEVLSKKESSYIVTGVIFGHPGEYIGENHVGVPTNFYKIAFMPDSKVMYAFLFDNNIEMISGDLSDFQVRVDDIEMIIQEDFFDKLTNDIEDKMESTIIPIE